MGSEMCIRDRSSGHSIRHLHRFRQTATSRQRLRSCHVIFWRPSSWSCAVFQLLFSCCLAGVSPVIALGLELPGSSSAVCPSGRNRHSVVSIAIAMFPSQTVLRLLRFVEQGRDFCRQARANPCKGSVAEVDSPNTCRSRTSGSQC